MCICLHVHSTVDTFPEIAMLLTLLKLKYLLWKEHNTLYNCIVEEDLNIFGNWTVHLYPVQTPHPSVLFNNTQLLILYGTVGSWMIMDHYWHTNRGKNEALWKKPNNSATMLTENFWPGIKLGASSYESLATNHLSHDAVKINPKYKHLNIYTYICWVIPGCLQSALFFLDINSAHICFWNFPFHAFSYIGCLFNYTNHM